MYLKTQLIGTTSSDFVPVETPEVLTARLDVLAFELEQAEHEYRVLMAQVALKDALGTFVVRAAADQLIAAMIN